MLKKIKGRKRLIGVNELVLYRIGRNPATPEARILAVGILVVLVVIRYTIGISEATNILGRSLPTNSSGIKSAKSAAR